MPRADVKFYMTAKDNIRAKRRFKELKSRGYKVNFKEVLKTIKMRDKSDLKRKISPLKRTKDSILIDSSYLTKKQCFKKMKKYIDYKFNKYVKY